MSSPDLSKIKNICFFNHFHNGDIFHSKEFVRDILNQTKLRGFYSHNCLSNIITDINIESVPIINIDNYNLYAIMNDTFFLNTWIGSRFNKGLKYTNECTLRFNYSMYEKIYDDVNKILITDLKLSPITNYFPTIDFSVYRTECIENFISTLNNNKKKVIISNGLCYSTQCEKYKDINPTLIKLVEKFKDVIFIATNQFNYSADNLYYTDYITAPRIGCDLNEIGYLSTFCDLIIGRNSGPYCFATNKQNILDINKTYFAFGERETDCFFHGINVPSKHIFHKFETEEKLNNELISLIERINNYD